MADGKQTTEDSAKTADGVEVSDRVISLSDTDSASSGKKLEPQQKGASKAGDASTSESNSSFVRLDAPQASNSTSADTSEELLSYGSGRVSQLLEEVQRSLTQVNLSAGASGERVVRTLDEAKSREHQFWNTQPVTQLSEQIGSTEKGPIEPDQPIGEVRDLPLTLPTGYKWDTLDLSDKAILDELYKLLYDNYVEDDEALFRFDYSREFLYWALHPPGWFPEWHVGVRTTNGKLLAFISGVPLTLKIFDEQKRLAEINFLCVHKRLRNKRLAPVLIREVTRRVHRRGMFQAVYTAGAYLPKPITTARYWHRSLNPKKLIDIKFSHLGRNMTMQRTIKLYKLPPDPVTAGIRPLTEADIPQTWPLVSEYFAKFDVSLRLDQEEFKHWFLPRENIVYSYVVEVVLFN
jgi:glycylpeptide N-tetradecanoyltransferase